MFTFAWSYVFLLLPLFWFAQKYLPSKQKKREAMLRVPFLSRIQTLNQGASLGFILPQQFKQFLSLIIWLLLITAAANPEWRGEPLPIKQSGHNIMLAIDISPSMEMPDLQQNNQRSNRLQTIKEVATNFIDQRQGDQLGLILFASHAYLQTPLTKDRKTILTMLDDASIGLAGESTAIGDAIGLGVKKLSTENIKSRILIVLTDGANNSGNIDPIEAAELAKDNHIKIYTVGIGASQMLLSSFYGTQVVNPSSDLDETMLKKIASITQGQYFRARDKTTLAGILEAINQLEPIDLREDSVRPITPLFYWPLSIAFFLLLLLLFPKLNMKARI